LNGSVAVCPINFLKELGFRHEIRNAAAIPPRLITSAEVQEGAVPQNRLSRRNKSLPRTRFARVTRSTGQAMCTPPRQPFTM
jgi:hypothetical protein